MYSQNNKCEQYREVGCNTADKGKLLMMLFDGCLNFLNLTQEGFAEKDWQKSGKYIQKSQAIISEFINTLDYKHGGDLPKKLASLYEFMLFYLTEANLEKSPSKVGKVIEILSKIAEGYREIIEINKVTDNSQIKNSQVQPDTLNGQLLNSSC
ncbi:MAG: flagellar export chaperone FliS [Deltaproteobacteria bacterium]|jgi:flagellar protein FliS|nr:flagellar export chaperone FliS [Deltaproteobacteria bacterium]